ncbi:hypothetical protein Rhopal_004197-T1 [Rhodotorula paludigena]|uniref:Uncharacterized protein n=1 Tax=Rhodotorula paludigena TaxID=86838 RepID=A0AAV5GL23_9BASI|nr:hypothetical protein Rhopal_004197-T1 [Rhodotorula paludigena]
MAAPSGRVGPSRRSSKRPELLKSTYDGGFEWFWTFELDNLDLTKRKIDTELEISTPMAGEWRLSVFADADDADKDCIVGLECRRPSACRDATADVRLYWTTEGNRCALIAEQLFSKVLSADVGALAEFWGVSVGRKELERAEEDSQGRFVAAKHRRYSLVVEMRQMSAVPLLVAADLKDRTPDTTRSPIPHDVRLFFPNAGSKGAEIWTTAHLLSLSSPYLKDLLSSDFAESVTLSSKKRQRRSAAPEQDVKLQGQSSKDYHDSDDEVDDLFLDNFPRPLFDLELLSPDHHHGDRHATYYATIRWLETGNIAFLDLTSQCKPQDPAATRTRDDYLCGELLGHNKSDGSQDCTKEPHSTPWCPVSSKSVYRLAHLLQLDHLQQVCLTNLGLNITHHAAARELFDNASVLYDAWREVLLDYVVEHWDDVTATSTWQEMDARIERDEVPGAAPILRQLMKRLKVKADEDKKQALVTASNSR